MKISTTSIGTYKPVPLKNHLQTDRKLETQNEPKITNEEKKYFSKLYPEQKDLIENYHFYNREGDKNGVSIGSLFDRRG